MNLALIAGCLVFPLIASAQDGQDHGCRTATLKDDYGLLVTGTRSLGPGLTETFATLSLITFDGKGSFIANGESQGSTTGLKKAPATGTYTVNADCTGTWTTNIDGIPPIVADFIIVDHGRDILVNTVSAGGVSTAIARKK